MAHYPGVSLAFAARSHGETFHQDGEPPDFADWCFVCVRVGFRRDHDSFSPDFHTRVIMRGRQEAGAERKEGRNGINQRQSPKNRCSLDRRPPFETSCSKGMQMFRFELFRIIKPLCFV